MRGVVQFESKGAKQRFQHNLNRHKSAMKKVKSRLDAAVPESYEFRQTMGSPTQKMSTVEQEIAKNNLNLANRIFNIMEGPGIISDILKDTTHPNNHPGTMNFKVRLKEAHRIHKQNMTMAARLDSVKAHYGTMVPPRPVKSAKGESRVIEKKKVKLSNSNFIPKLKLANIFQNEDDDGDYEYFEEDPDIRTEEDGRPTSCRSDKPINNRVVKLSRKPQLGSKSARGPNSARNKEERGSKLFAKGASNKSKAKPNKRSQNVLLEYSKIQDGHVLDVAVIKEPFQDRYAIFGIDIDNGQRYELRLSSEDVSSVLDGDILVTSVDNLEVWMALLNKVRLAPVDAFSKLPANNSEEPATNDISSANTTTQVYAEPSPVAALDEENLYQPDYDPIEQEVNPVTSSDNAPVAMDSGVVLQPKAPDSARPSTRPGGRGSRASSAKDAQNTINQTSFPPSSGFETITDVSVEPIGEGLFASAGEYPEFGDAVIAPSSGSEKKGSTKSSTKSSTKESSVPNVDLFPSAPVEEAADVAPVASRPPGSAEKGAPARGHRTLTPSKDK